MVSGSVYSELGSNLKDLHYEKFMAKGLIYNGINYQEANYNKICETPDGKIWFSGGDHNGTNRFWRTERYDVPWGYGNTTVCSYDPATDEVELAFELDRASAIYSNAETPGHGKIHANIVTDSKGIIYTAGYLGTSYAHDRTQLFYPKSYAGGSVFRYDPGTKVVESLGIPCPGCGIVSLYYDEKRSTVHGLDVDRCRYWRLNVDTMALKYYETNGRMNAGRDMIVDHNGCVYFPNKFNGLTRFNPDTQQFDDIDIKLPQDNFTLRGHVVTSDNVIYGITFYGMFWSYDTNNGTYKEYGNIFGDPDERTYVPSPALDESRGRIYFLGTTTHGESRQDHKKILTIFDMKKEKFYYAGLLDIYKTCYGSMVASDHTLYFCVSTWETDENGNYVKPPEENYENMYDPANEKIIRPYLIKYVPPETLDGMAEKLTR